MGIYTSDEKKRAQGDDDEHCDESATSVCEIKSVSCKSLKGQRREEGKKVGEGGEEENNQAFSSVNLGPAFNVGFPRLTLTLKVRANQEASGRPCEDFGSSDHNMQYLYWKVQLLQVSRTSTDYNQISLPYCLAF